LELVKEKRPVFFSSSKYSKKKNKDKRREQKMETSRLCPSSFAKHPKAELKVIGNNLKTSKK
jgi:hypothetical protein